MRKSSGWLLCALALALPAGVGAQVAWDGPYLVPPRAASAMGIYLMDVDGGGLGVMGTWRSPGWNFGLRGGLAEDAREDLGIFAGIDYAGPVNRSTDEFPLDIDWVFGAGIGISDGARVSIPVGLTGGHTFVAEGANFTPWVTPRIFLDARFGQENQDSDVDLGLAVDLGLDLQLRPASSRTFSGMTIRFGASVGDREAVAIGLVF